MVRTAGVGEAVLRRMCLEIPTYCLALLLSHPIGLHPADALLGPAAPDRQRCGRLHHRRCYGPHQRLPLQLRPARGK